MMNEMQFRQLKSCDETVVYYKIMDEGGHYSRNTYSLFSQKPCDERSLDVANAIEYTLHQILDAGGTDEDVERFTGLVKSTGEESEVYIDLDYVIPGSPCYYDFSSEPLRETLYQRFKLYWMADHGYTLDAFVSSITEYADEEYGIYDDLVSEWELECGFNGTLYPCYEEFICSEYQDKGLVELLCNTEEEKEQYKEDPMIQED